MLKASSWIYKRIFTKYSEESPSIHKLLVKLNLKLCDHRTDKNDIENIEIAIDSTVMHIYSNSTQHNKDNAKIRKYHKSQ
ncbi:hypothetical protein [Wolbachia endosymbiont (group B) of Germaria angustata]|uniref:hypothetical protein n=1 Tax=Wolbachia endosymbiont (group B) of Germaria angustata TaxID=3077916 RepID=UPI0031330042